MQDLLAQPPQAQLLDVLCAGGGIVCVIGAGGKKTTMYALARAHPGRVGITTTVHIPPFPRSLDAHAVIAAPARIEQEVIAAAPVARRLAYACIAGKPGRHAGVPAHTIERIHRAARFDLTLIKADGARRRLLKAAGPGEPCVPAHADTVIAVASAQVVGERLHERVVHHVEEVARVAELRPGERLGPQHVARVLAAALSAAELPAGARRVALINMVDEPRHQAAATAIAEEVLMLAPQVSSAVAASMRSPQPIVWVSRRGGAPPAAV